MRDCVQATLLTKSNFLQFSVGLSLAYMTTIKHCFLFT